MNLPGCDKFIHIQQLFFSSFTFITQTLSYSQYVAFLIEAFSFWCRLENVQAILSDHQANYIMETSLFGRHVHCLLFIIMSHRQWRKKPLSEFKACFISVKFQMPETCHEIALSLNVNYILLKIIIKAWTRGILTALVEKNNGMKMIRIVISGIFSSSFEPWVKLWNISARLVMKLWRAFI